MDRPHWGEPMATSVIALLPILLVFLAAQRHFVRGPRSADSRASALSPSRARVDGTERRPRHP
jgi:hypothetical protein